MLMTGRKLNRRSRRSCKQSRQFFNQVTTQVSMCLQLAFLFFFVVLLFKVLLYFFGLSFQRLHIKKCCFQMKFLSFDELAFLLLLRM